MTTDKYINRKAEQQHMSDQLGYVDGLTHGLDIAVGFLSWYIENEVQTTWYEQFIYNDSTYTIEQLLELYLDTLKTK